MSGQTYDELAAAGLLIPEILFVPGVAAALCVTPRAARKLMADGRIPATRLGRRWCTTRAALLAALTPAAARFRSVPQETP